MVRHKGKARGASRASPFSWQRGDNYNMNEHILQYPNCITARAGLAYDAETDAEQIGIDNELIGRIAADDEDAFNQFYQRWHGYVSARIQNRIRNPHDAQEAINEVFSKVWQSRKRCWWELTSEYVRYFYGIICNTILNYLRQAKRSVCEVEFEDYHAPVYDAEAVADRDAWRERMQVVSEQLNAAIDGLDFKTRCCIVDVVANGWSVRSVANEHKTTTYAVERRIDEGLTQLREELEPYIVEVD